MASTISLADIEDILAPYHSKSNDLWTGRDPNSDSSTSSTMDEYRLPGTFIDREALNILASRITQLSNKFSGHGTGTNITQNFVSRLDRHMRTFTPLNHLNYGYTFITRPRLNCTRGNLRQHPITATLASEQPNSIPFMIRALLDTKTCNGIETFIGSSSSYGGVSSEATQFNDLVLSSGLVDPLNPFLVPLCNGLKGISGFPDFNLEIETTEGDVHSGDFTFVKGSDMNNKTQELSLEFRDINGSVILSILYFWCLMMALQAKGVVMAHEDDIYEQRLNYTVSIYRFITDMARKNILWWCKATGCYPKMAPVGALFNVNQSEVTISSAMNFSIPFVANDIKVNDPGALLDFNRLMDRYTGEQIRSTDVFTPVEMNASDNFNALPYIVSTSTGLMLEWRTAVIYQDDVDKKDAVQSITEVMKEILARKQSNMESLGGESDYSDVEYEMPVPDENGILT